MSSARRGRPRRRCVLRRRDDLDWLAVHVARLGFEAEVLEPPELREAVARLARRLAVMAGPG